MKSNVAIHATHAAIWELVLLVLKLSARIVIVARKSYITFDVALLIYHVDRVAVFLFHVVMCVPKYAIK